MIKLQVIGHLGKDCIVNTVNGKNVINFSVAHSEKFRDSSGVNQERTIWVECAYWTDKTTIAPYLQKGTQVFVEGPPELRTFTRGDGTSGTSLTMRVRDIQLLGRKGDNAGGIPAASDNSSYNRQATPAAPANMDEVSDDLPF